MLKHIYGDNIFISDHQITAFTARSLIDASDKYGLDDLKQVAELRYIESFRITVDNVADTLLYADAKNCGELKQEAMDYLTEHIDEAVERRSIGQLYQSESLTDELMLAMSKRARSS